MQLPGFTAVAALRELTPPFRSLGLPAPKQAGQVVPQFCYRNGISLCCTDPIFGVVCKVHWSVQAPLQ